MTFLIRTIFALATGMLLAAGPAQAHEYEIGDLFIDHPWARATFSAATPGAVYLRIVNRGESNDRLVAASTPRAEVVEIHETVRTNEIRIMQPRPNGVVIPAGGEILLEPGGLHLMLIGLDGKLEAGQSFPLRLEFENAGAGEVVVNVEAHDGH